MLDVSFVSVYNNEWITEPSNTTDFCTKCIKHSPIGFKKCEECHRIWENAVKKERKPMLFKCYTGLTTFASPIFMENEYVGCILGGQILTEQPDENYIRKIAKKYKLNEDKCVCELRKVRVIPEEKVRNMSEVVFFLSNTIALMYYTNYQLSNMNIPYKPPKNQLIEEWFYSKYGNTKKPISSREYEVLKLLVLGKSNTEIAKDLFISTHTVKAHVSSILEKLEVTDRVQVAVKAVREGIIK